MSYDFNYDPLTGETPWPMKWTIAPTQYNREVLLGNSLTFWTQAVPDPNYPSAWAAHYATATEFSVDTSTVPPLPPEPVILEYIYSPSSSIDEEFVHLSVDNGPDGLDGLYIDNLDTELFFPYDNISYFKNDEKKSAQFPEEVIDDGYDYVTALVPNSSEFIILTSIVTVKSTSKSNLEGTFRFKINNNWDKARTTLETLSVRSKEYFSELVGDASLEPPNPPESNQASSGTLSTDLPPVDDLVDEFKEKQGQSYDEFFRTASEVDINTIVDDTAEFLDGLENETISDAVDTVEGYADTAQGAIDAVTSINDAIRDGNIEELMTKFGYTYDEVMNLFKGI